MAASTTAPEPPTPHQPQAASLECPRTDDKVGSDLSDTTEGGLECCSDEVGVDSIEGEENGGHEAPLEKSCKTNGESVDEAFGLSAK